MRRLWSDTTAKKESDCPDVKYFNPTTKPMSPDDDALFLEEIEKANYTMCIDAVELFYNQLGFRGAK